MNTQPQLNNEVKQSTELKPCPFCGKQPQKSDRATADNQRVWFIYCMCGGYSAHAHQHGYSEKEATKNWNRRVIS